MKHHDKIKDYLCNFCGKKFAQKTTLLSHLRTHSESTQAQPYRCSHCDFTAVQHQLLKQHNYYIHKIGSDPVKASDKQKPNQKTKESKVKALPYACTVCFKAFKLPSTLSKHQQTHFENRKHVCEHCSASFKRAEHLRIHVNSVHLKQRPYKCEFCEKSFAQAGDRNVHMKRHFNERPHHCKFCNKSFRLLKSKKAHQRIHTGSLILSN
jgi:KRAB domain-containing zinc finger protein